MQVRSQKILNLKIYLIKSQNNFPKVVTNRGAGSQKKICRF